MTDVMIEVETGTERTDIRPFQYKASDAELLVDEMRVGLKSLR